MKRLVLFATILLALTTVSFAQYTFTAYDVPDSVLTTCRGINNHGDTVGAYAMPGETRHAYVYRNGSFAPLLPDTILGTNYSEALKINDRGDIVGWFLGDDWYIHGFRVKDGILTIIDFPGAGDTYVQNISEAGLVVGTFDFLDSQGNLNAYHGFTWQEGLFTQVDYPGAVDTWAQGINARGDIVGDWDMDPYSPIFHGFIYSKGTFKSLDVPFENVDGTDPMDINEIGEVVGNYVATDGTVRGFTFIKDKFTSIEFPDSSMTFVDSINNAGQISGRYWMPDPVHGFIGTPESKGKPVPE